MEAFAFPAAKTSQWPDLFIAHEGFEFISAQQATGDGFPDCELAVLIRACEALESFDNRRTAARAPAERLRVRHVFVRMKMLCFTYNVLGQITDLSHERFTHKLAVLNLTKAKFPFAGELWTRQFWHCTFQKRSEERRVG